MSIADKLSYLQTTKEKIKNALGDRVTDTTPFRKYADEVDFINLNLDNSLKYRVKEEAEGTEMTLTNCAELLTEEQEIWSNGIEQESRERYNLIDIDNFTTSSITAYGITLTNNGDGTFNISGTSEAAVQFTMDIPNIEKIDFSTKYYTMKTNTTGFIIQIPLYNGSTWVATPIGRAETWSDLKVSTNSYIKSTYNKIQVIIRFSANVTLDLKNVYIMLYEGTENKDFEPYGAMPSLDYPSDIYGVTGDVGVKVQNRNLLNIPDYTYTWNGSTVSIKKDILTVLGNTSNASGLNYQSETVNTRIKKNTTLSFSAKHILGSWSSGTCKIGITVVYEDESTDGVSIEYSTATQNSVLKTTLTTTKNVVGYYIRGLTYNMSGINELLTFQVQLEEGIVATDYIEHQEQTYPLSLGDITLYGNDTVRDSIVRKDGKWYLYKEWKKFIEDSSVYNYVLRYSNSTTGITTFGREERSVMETRINGFTYSNCFKFTRQVDNAYSGKLDGDVVYSDSTFLQFSTSKASTVAEFTELLKNNNAYTVCRLKESVYEEITDQTLLSQLNDLTHLSTYEDYTYITITPETENSLTPVLKLDYYDTIKPAEVTTQDEEQ